MIVPLPTRSKRTDRPGRWDEWRAQESRLVCKANAEGEVPMSDSIQRFDPPDLKTPVRGFHTTIRTEGLVFLAGMTGRSADGEVVEGFDAQTTAAFERIREGLALAGAEAADVVQLMFFLVAHEERSFAQDFGVVMAAKEAVLPGCAPVGTAVRVSELFDPRLFIEIQAVARAKD